MMAFVCAGDIVIVENISRIAKNIRELLPIISDLAKKNVLFFSLEKDVDTTAPHGRFMRTVFGALAELERESILERQREGIGIAKVEGKYFQSMKLTSEPSAPAGAPARLPQLQLCRRLA